MKNIFLIVYTVTLVVSCSKNNKSNDNQFVQEYNDCLNYVCSSLTDTVYSIKMQNSVMFLTITSGIELEGFDIEHGIFYKESTLKKYLKNWKSWIEENKDISKGESDSLKHLFNVKWGESPAAPNRPNL